jgi:hypothetical protein
MRKLAKFLGWTLGLTLAAVLALFLTLKFYFTPERVRTLIMEYAGKNLKREISLDTASISPRGFFIRNLKVAEAGGFGRGQFMSAEEFSVRPDFKALLKKELKIKSIRASGLTLSIVQVSKETYNLSDLLPGTQAAAPKLQPAAGPEKPMGLSVSDIIVKNARILYSNSDRSMTVTLSDLNLGVRSLTPEELFPFETDFTLAVKSPYLTGDFPVRAEGRIALGGWDPRKGRAEIEKATLKAGNIFCELKGGLTNLTEPDAALELRVKAFSSTELKPYFAGIPPRILLPAVEADSVLKITPGSVSFKKLDFKAGPAQGSIKGRVSWDPVFDYSLAADIQAQTPEFDTTDVARKFRAVPKNIKIPLADIGARLTLSPKKIRLLAASVSAKSVKLSAAGEFSPAPASAVSAGLKFSAVNIRDLAAMFAPLKEYGLTGSVSGGVDFAMNAKAMVLRGRAAFSDIGASAAGTRLSEMTGSAEFSGGNFRADAAGKLEGSPLKFSVSARNYPAHPQITLNADLEAFRFKAPPPQQPQAGPAQTAATKKEPAGAKAFAFDISGRTRLGSIAHPNLAAGETVLTYNLKNVSENPALLSGTAAFYANGGKFANLYELAKQHKAAKIALYPLIILGKAGKLAKGLQLPDFNTIAFTKMEGDYIFQDGAMKIQKSALNSDVADADTSGGVNLVSETLDLKISTRLKQASGINLSAPLAMTVKGTFDAPSVKPDVKSIIAQPVVKENVQKLLRKLLK